MLIRSSKYKPKSPGEPIPYKKTEKARHQFFHNILNDLSFVELPQIRFNIFTISIIVLKKSGDRDLASKA